MKFKKSDLQEMAGGDTPNGFEVLKNEIDGRSRWSVEYVLVFNCDGKFYESGYRSGATEQQEERPYEYDDDEIDCDEVVQVKKTIIVYERKKK